MASRVTSRCIRWPACKRALGLLKRARFGGEVSLHGLQRGGLFAELELEVADGPAEICELVRSLRLHLVELEFEAAYGHGKFRAQLILIGLNLRHRLRGQIFQPMYGEAYRAHLHQRNNADNEQARDQKPDPDIHDLFDHDAPRTRSTLILPECHGALGHSSPPARYLSIIRADTRAVALSGL